MLISESCDLRKGILKLLGCLENISPFRLDWRICSWRRASACVTVFYRMFIYVDASSFVIPYKGSTIVLLYRCLLGTLKVVVWYSVSYFASIYLNIDLRLIVSLLKRFMHVGALPGYFYLADPRLKLLLELSLESNLCGICDLLPIRNWARDVAFSFDSKVSSLFNIKDGSFLLAVLFLLYVSRVKLLVNDTLINGILQTFLSYMAFFSTAWWKLCRWFYRALCNTCAMWFLLRSKARKASS